MGFAIRIPEDLRKKYVDRRAKDAEEISHSLADHRFDVLSRVGHQLKGNAATFGYASLAALGQRMELSAERQSFSEAEECLLLLKAWLKEQSYSAKEAS